MRKFRQISECYLFLIEEKIEFLTKIKFSDLLIKMCQENIYSISPWVNLVICQMLLIFKNFCLDGFPVETHKCHLVFRNINCRLRCPAFRALSSLFSCRVFRGWKIRGLGCKCQGSDFPSFLSPRKACKCSEEYLLPTP